MKAVEIANRLIAIAEGRFARIVVWRVPRPLRGSMHDFKYRLAYVVDDVCVLRYDNEAGKGDHRHCGEVESRYVFIDLDQLLADFQSDIARWNDENRPVRGPSRE
ncbi:MAG: hypothetical protein JSR34_05335 [Proteobacteria bacterium]|nr:hypothetical protein [Pseudomonadota bacterium]